MQATRPLRVEVNTPDDPTSPDSPYRSVIITSTVLGVLFLLFGGIARLYFGTPSADDAVAAAVLTPPTPPPAIATPVPTPVCLAYQAPVATVSKLLAEGRLQAAAELAQHHVSDPLVALECPQARSTLLALGYSAQAQQLLSQISVDGGEEARIRWLHLQAWADGEGLEEHQRLSPHVVLSQAYSLGSWALAHEAFITLWGSGGIDPADAQMLVKYISILRNWGNDLYAPGRVATQARAEQLLATAQTIADTLRLPIGEPCTDLQAWGVEHCRQIPPDYDNPILADLLAREEE
jgi:hypothetical protein